VKGTTKMNFAGERKQPAVIQHCVCQREGLLGEFVGLLRHSLPGIWKINLSIYASSQILQKAVRKRGHPQEMGFLCPEGRK